jgi:hypothetical protein
MTAPTKPQIGNSLRQSGFLVFLVVGVISSFTIFGYAQEALTRTEFGPAKERFKLPTFLIVVQSFANTMI